MMITPTRSVIYCKETEKGTKMAEHIKKVPKRILSRLMSSLSAGVVPRSGAPYIAIGRQDEIESLLSDLDRVADGDASMRLLIGRYGSGKSFLIQLMRGYALDRGFVSADCDLSTERKLCGTNGAGIATYRELMRNLATKASPDGGALPLILSSWISDIKASVLNEGLSIDSPEFDSAVRAKIHASVRKLESGVGGFDLALVLSTYFDACEADDEIKKSACLRYLRGEFANKTEARSAIHGISSVIGDDNWYDSIKLICRLVTSIGYKGLVVFIDECVNLYKIPNRISRENNYEKLLMMFNDTLEGRAENLMLVFGGTPQFLEDRRRGLFSYEALRSRLSDGKYDTGKYKNMIGPVIRLRRLSDNELYALILRVTSLHAEHYSWTPRVTNEDAQAFLTAATSAAGADLMITPREIIRDYISVLNILYQNPDATFESVIGDGISFTPDAEAGADEAPAEVTADAEVKHVSAFNPEDIII